MLHTLELIRRCVKVHPGGKSEIIGAALGENCALRRAWEFPSLLSECYMGKPIILQHTHIILMTAVDKISLNVSKYKQNPSPRNNAKNIYLVKFARQKLTMPFYTVSLKCQKYIIANPQLFKKTGKVESSLTGRRHRSCMS